MPIDFSVQTDEWWKASFERYITGGNDFETIKSGGNRAIGTFQYMLTNR